MRRGYTLFEILLVVALISILAGMLVPGLIESAYGDRTRLQAAADQITGQWSAMRARAIIEGRPYRFSVAPGTGDFRVAPDASGSAGGGENGGLVVQDSLPHGIQFAMMNATAPNADGGSDGANGAGSSDAGSGSWSTAAVFLPDGTAQQDVEIRIKAGVGGPISIRLRALTGGITTRWVRDDENP